MPMTLTTLRQNGKFRALDMNTQLSVSQQLWFKQLSQDPRFAALDEERRRKLVRNLSLQSATFEDESLGDYVRKTGYGYANYESGAGFDKATYELVNSAIRTSGIAGALGLILGGEAGAVRRKDRERSLQYFNAVESISGRSDGWAAAGAVLGFVGDIVAVNMAMAPAVSAASRGIQAVARGIPQAAAKGMTAQALMKAPMLYPKLAFYGPIAAESLIEALPYFYVEESRRKAQGQPTVLSGGAGEVAKVLGVNAAADFIVGTALVSLLQTSAKVLGQVFKKGHLAEPAYETLAEMDQLLKDFRTGSMSKVVVDNLLPLTQARKWQANRIAEFLDHGAAAPADYLQARAAYLANDLGQIWAPKIQRGDEFMGGYDLWDLSGKAPMSKTYQSFNDLENDLSYDFFKRYKGLAPEEQALKLRPENQWAYDRGQLLFEQTIKLEPEKWMDVDPALASRWTMKPRSPRSRNVITKAEADYFQGSAGSSTVIQANVPLKADVLSNAQIHEFNLWRGKAAVRVMPSDTPNAMFTGTKVAPLEEYLEAQKRLPEILELNTFHTPEEALSSTMLNRGYDHVKFPDGSVEFFSTRGARLIGTPEDVLISLRKPAASGSAASRVVVNEVVTKHITPAEFGKNSDLVAHAAQKVVRSSEPQMYRDFTKLYLATDNVDDIIRVRQIDGPRITATRHGGRLDIGIPRKVASYADELEGTRSLFKGLDEVAVIHGTRAKGMKSADYLANRIASKPAKFGFPAGIDPTPWAESVATSLGGKLTRDGVNFSLELPSGITTATDISDIVDTLAKKTLDMGAVRNDLMMQGARIVRLGDGTFQIRSHKTGKLLADGPDLSSVLTQIDYQPKTISNAFGPKTVRVTEHGLEFDVGSSKVLKSQAEAQAYISKFSDTAGMQRQELVRAHANGVVTQTPMRQYEVYLSKYDVYQRFENPGDAVKFLTTDAKSLDELADIAAKKGLDLYVENGDYMLVARDRTMRASSLDELGQRFREYPDLEKSARSILDDIDPDYEASVADVVAQFRDNRPMAGMNRFGLPPEYAFPDRKPMSAFTSLLKSTEQTTAWVEGVSKEIGDPEFLRKYRAVEHGARAADAENNKAVRFFDTLFRDDNGKYLSNERLQKLFYTVGQTSPEATAGLARQYQLVTGKVLGALDPVEERIAKGMRDYMESMSVNFGISFEKLIFDQNYMPRLRNLRAADNKGLLNELSIADELVGRMGMTQKEIKFWAEFERSDDLIRYSLKDNAMEVMMLYTTQGNKKLYMNDAWRDLARYMKETNMESGITKRMAQYQEALMGATRSTGEKAMEDFGEKFFTALKRNPITGKFIKASEIEMADMGRELFRSMLGLTYVSSMGWKPFLAIRNSFQPWPTAAARIGPEWISAGLQKVLKDPEMYYKAHVALGVISEKAPIVNQVLSRQTKLGRIAEGSLQWFKNADDLTRSWTYEAAGMRFQNAIDALGSGKIATRAQFEDLSGLDMMDQVLKDDTWKTITTHPGRDVRMDALAKHNFALKFEEETMFPYRASESPTMYQGLVGKLFGQFGTYSVAYRANVARMFQNAPYAKRAAMVANYLAISGALWGTFAALKIKTNDFIPFAPAFFTGGPLFDNAVDVIRSTDTGYEGLQARARLKYSLPSLIPGSAQKRYLEKALKYAEAGDSYRSWLSLTGVPVFEE